MIPGDACFAYFNRIWGIPSISSCLSEQASEPAHALVHDWVEVGTGCKLRYIPDMAALTQSHRNSNPFWQASAPTLIGWRRSFRLPHWRCRCRWLNSVRAAPLEVRVAAGHCLRFCNESALSFRFTLSEVGHAT